MAEVFVARQPIFNRQLEVTGYELLFRDGLAPGAEVADAEGATAAVVMNSLTEIGLERIVGRHPAWINVTRKFVLGGFAQSLPRGLVLLELLENQLIDDKLIAALAELRQQGYRLALDDFQYSDGVEPLLAIVDVVKLDLLALGRRRLAREVDRCRPYGVALLAEKLESQSDYAYCDDAGCDLFQGYFFCRPEIVRSRGVDANRLSLLELLAALQDPAVELATLERTIALDIKLSYRLLRYINSVFFGLRQEVRSIGQALALLGVENLEHWAALSVFASIDGKPAELTVTALIRARFCELASQQLRGANPSELFTLGLFSVVDAMMDMPMAQVLARMPFPPDVREALSTHTGAKGRLLESVIAVEAGDFDRAQGIVADAAELYLSALTWATAAAGPLFAETGAVAA